MEQDQHHRGFLDFTSYSYPAASTFCKVNLPFAVAVRAFFPSPSIPLLSTNNLPLLRCTECSAYLNPYATYSPVSQSWTCSLCETVNTLKRPWSDIDSKQLSEYCYEVPAGAEFVQKPPPVPTYAFVLDISPIGASNGSLKTMCDKIKKLVEDGTFPQSDCKLAVISYDTSIHYYLLKSTLRQPKMVTVAEDFEELPLPLNELVCDFEEAKKNFVALLESLPKSVNPGPPKPSCLGSVVEKLKKILEYSGGKAIVFQVAEAIKENSATVSSDKSVTGMNKFLGITDTFYRTLGTRLAIKKITCDLFVISNVYKNINNIGQLPAATSGFFYYYPYFSKQIDSVRLEKDLRISLCENTAYDSFTRLRLTKGFIVEEIIGNCAGVPPDMVTQPVGSSEKSYMFKVARKPKEPSVILAGDIAFPVPIMQREPEEFAVTKHIILQVASLYTTTERERRFRVFTQKIPVAENFEQWVSTINNEVLANYLAKSAVLRVRSKLNFKDGKNLVLNFMKGVVSEVLRSGPAAEQLLNQINPLIAYTLGMLKHSMFSEEYGKTSMELDKENYKRYMLLDARAETSAYFFFPVLYQIHTIMKEDVGGFSEDGSVKLPVPLRLTKGSLDSRGIYLLDNGMTTYFWLGSECDPNLAKSLQDILAGVVPSYEKEEFRIRVERIMHTLQEYLFNLTSKTRSKQMCGSLEMVIQDTSPEIKFLKNLYEDEYKGLSYTSYYKLLTS